MILKDTAEAIQASLPHAETASEAGREMLELIRELRDPHSGLSDEERAAAQRRITELSEQTRRENEAAERPYKELSARLPDWADY